MGGGVTMASKKDGSVSLITVKIYEHYQGLFCPSNKPSWDRLLRNVQVLGACLEGGFSWNLVTFPRRIRVISNIEV